MAVSPKHRINPPSFKTKLGRPPKSSAVDKMTVKQLVSNEMEKAQCQKRKRATTHDDSDEDDKVKSATMERAREVQANLSSKFPSLIKYMLHSHVTRGFWLGLPKQFCSKHLLEENTMMVLEDEEGKEYQAKYLAGKIGLSGGWRGFSIAHKLLEGDACVFHLVKPTKFKVYIVRREDADEVDVALGLLRLDAPGKKPKVCGETRNEHLEENGIFEERMGAFLEEIFLLDDSHDVKHLLMYENDENNSPEELTTDRTLKEVLPQDISEENIQKNDGMLFSSNIGPKVDQSENQRVALGPEALDQIRLSESTVDFKEVKSFEDFNILFNGLVIDSELSKYLQSKYYELCCSKKSFLHEKLLEGLNCKLVAGLIAETINIADAIRAARLTTSYNDLVTWNQTLKSFEGLGMKVGFLRARLDQLMKLSLKAKRYQEARLELVHVQEEKSQLEEKLVEVTQTLRGLDMEIESLGEDNIDRFQNLFQEVAKAPW